MPAAALVVCLLLTLIAPAVAAQESPKPVVALLDVTGDGVSAAEATAVSNLLASAIYDTGLVEVIDRTRRQELLAEVEFSLSDCTDESCAIQVGKLLAADVMVVGSVNRVGKRLAVDLKAVEVESSRIIGTSYQLFDSIDAIVDGLKTVGAQLTQDFTGGIAQKKELLRYEEIVPLTVSCDIEGAMVSVDGVSAGQISGGRLTKVVNKGAEVTVLVQKDGYYPRSTRVVMDAEKIVSVSLDRFYRHLVSVDATFGGGAMGTILVGLAPRANWWVLKLGAGFTVTSTEPALLNLPVLVKSDWYLQLDDRSLLRPYLGATVLVNLLRLYEFSSLNVNPALWHDVNIGLELGLELRIAEPLRAYVEADTYVTQLLFDTMKVLQLGAGLRLKL